MEFQDPPRRRADPSLLPMINVVFLLLIFFLISARMTPPDPFALQPPEAAADELSEVRGNFVLHLAGDGRLAFAEVMEDAALDALQAARGAYCATADCTVDPPTLTLRADAGMEASGLTAVLPRIAALGFASVELAVQPARTAP